MSSTLLRVYPSELKIPCKFFITSFLVTLFLGSWLIIVFLLLASVRCHEKMRWRSSGHAAWSWRTGPTSTWPSRWNFLSLLLFRASAAVHSEGEWLAWMAQYVGENNEPKEILCQARLRYTSSPELVQSHRCCLSSMCLISRLILVNSIQIGNEGLALAQLLCRLLWRCYLITTARTSSLCKVSWCGMGRRWKTSCPSWYVLVGVQFMYRAIIYRRREMLLSWFAVR